MLIGVFVLQNQVLFMNNDNKSQNLFTGIVLMCFAIFVWGITFVCTKSLINNNLSPLEILFVRFLMAYAGLWIIRPKKMILENKKDNLLFILAGLSGVTVYQLMENMAISFTSASNVSVIVSICPMFTAIIAQIFLKEKHVTPVFVIGFFIAIFGVALVSLNGKMDLTISPKGDLLALASGVSWGFYSLFVSLINRKYPDSICATRRVFFFAVIFMIPLVILGSFMPETSTLHVNWSPSVNAERFSNLVNWLNLGFLGLAASAFCFSAWNKACDIIGTVKATVGIYLIPVVTIIFAWIFLDEKITLMGGIGAVITIVGLCISGKR